MGEYYFFHKQYQKTIQHLVTILEENHYHFDAFLLLYKVSSILKEYKYSATLLITVFKINPDCV